MKADKMTDKALAKLLDRQAILGCIQRGILGEWTDTTGS